MPLRLTTTDTRGSIQEVGKDRVRRATDKRARVRRETFHRYHFVYRPMDFYLDRYVLSCPRYQVIDKTLHWTTRHTLSVCFRTFVIRCLLHYRSVIVLRQRRGSSRSSMSRLMSTKRAVVLNVLFQFLFRHHVTVLCHSCVEWKGDNANTKTYFVLWTKTAALLVTSCYSVLCRVIQYTRNVELTYGRHVEDISDLLGLWKCFCFICVYN